MLALLRVDQQLPLNGTDTRGVLVMVLRRERMPFRNANFVATRCATIDAGIRCCDTGRKQFVISRTLGLGQMLTVLVLSHMAPYKVSVSEHAGGNLTVRKMRINYPHTGLHSPVCRQVGSRYFLVALKNHEASLFC